MKASLSPFYVVLAVEVAGSERKAMDATRAIRVCEETLLRNLLVFACVPKEVCKDLK